MVVEKMAKGYRQTEIGTIPEDWKVKSLGEVSISIASGKSNTSSEIGNYPIYGSTSIIGYKKNADYQGKKILVARVGANAGAVNKVAGRYCVSDNTLMITYPFEIDIDFSYYQLVNFKINKMIFGSGQPLITGSQLKSIRLPFPPTKEEQSAIALVLSDTDKLILSLNKLIEKKKNIKQGVIQELLTGKKRLPGFGCEWEIRKLSEIFVLTSGKTKSKFLENDGKFVIMDMGSVSTEGKNISSKKTNHLEDLLEYGDLVMPKDDIGGGNIIGKVVFIEKNNKYVLGDHVYKLKAINPKTNTLFHSYLINSYHTNAELRKKAAGSAQLGLSRKDVENQEVKTTMDTMEQLAIAQLLSDIDFEIEALEQKRDKYKQLKIGMMQQLLTGRVRLEWKN